jgi:hypothetical protein
LICWPLGVFVSLLWHRLHLFFVSFLLFAALSDELSKVNTDIKRVEDEISAAEAEAKAAKAAGDTGELAYWRKKEEQLRKKEEQLRDEKVLLLQHTLASGGQFDVILFFVFLSLFTPYLTTSFSYLLMLSTRCEQRRLRRGCGPRFQRCLPLLLLFSSLISQLESLNSHLESLFLSLFESLMRLSA